MSGALKTVLRKQLLEQRRACASKIDEASAIPKMIKMIETLLALNLSISNPQTRIMAGYYPINQEFNVLPILRHFYTSGWTIALPKTQGRGKGLTFLQWKDMDPGLLKKGPYGILIPDQAQAAVVNPSVLLLPLVGFSKSCARLGYGAGYFDQGIAALSLMGALRLTVGIAFELQRCDAIPVEERDQILHAVVTNEHVYTHAGIQEL